MYAEVDMRRNGKKGHSQDNYTKKVNNPDRGAYNHRDGKEVGKENEQSHCWKLMRNTNWLAMKFSRPARFALAAEVQAAANIMSEEMPGLDEGTIGLGLTTDSKSLQ